MPKGVKTSLSKTVGNHIKNLLKQLFLPERTLCKLPAIGQQLLSALTFGHLLTTRMCLHHLWQGQP